MTTIAAMSVQSANRLPAASAVAMAQGLADALAPAISARNTPAPGAQAIASRLMSALIEVQSQIGGPSPDSQQVLQSVVQAVPDHSTSPASVQIRTPTSLDSDAGLTSKAGRAGVPAEAVVETAQTLEAGRISEAVWVALVAASAERRAADLFA